MVRKQTTSLMLLFLYAMLIVALLILVVAGARLYGGVLDSKNDRSNSRAALSYVQTQSAGFSGSRVTLRQGPEGTMLCLAELEEDYETRIYLYDHALRSEFAAVEVPVDPAVSQKICELNEFSICWQDMGNGLLCIDADGSIGYAYCAGGGGDA